MIDFRYHLVSLVSVFLALAVGIVLGAGPLKEPIATGLSQSVQDLRRDRDSLNQQLKTAQAGIGNRDAFLGQVQDGLVSDQLGGRTVVLVTLPGADGDAVPPLTKALTQAGATITGRIDVQNAWVDPASRVARDQAVASLAGTPTTAGPGATPSRTPSPSPSSAAAGQAQAAALLARAVVTPELSSSERADPTGRALLDGLVRAGLVDTSGFTKRATQAVVLAPGVTQAVDGGAATPSPSPTADVLSAWTSLASALDSGSAGTVVVGPASSATGGGVVAAVRGQAPVAAAVSTVDTGGTPMGDITTVFALREQQLDRAGSYGFGEGAKAPLPLAAGG